MSVMGIVLAGGKSSRMGTNKALLEVGGKRNIERAVKVLHQAADDVLIVTNTKEEYEFLGCPMVSDRVQGKGPLAGLEAGLAVSRFDTTIVAACDMPFLSQHLLQYMLKQAPGFDAVVPLIEGKLHPLLAVYKKSALPTIQQCLQQDQLRMVHVLSLLRVKYIEEKEIQKAVGKDMSAAFFNMNRPEDYETAKDIERIEKEVDA